MATVERNGKVTIMKYNNFIDTNISISIRDSDDNEVLLLDQEVRFLHEILTKWIEEAKE